MRIIDEPRLEALAEAWDERVRRTVMSGVVLLYIFIGAPVFHREELRVWAGTIGEWLGGLL